MPRVIDPVDFGMHATRFDVVTRASTRGGEVGMNSSIPSLVAPVVYYSPLPSPSPNCQQVSTPCRALHRLRIPLPHIPSQTRTQLELPP